MRKKLIHDIERPVNKAVLLGRIICSHVDCIAKKELFHNNGIAHHFRVSHKQEWTQALRSESMNVARKLHEQETRECIEKVFEYRRTEVQYVYFMQISFG
jgi:pyruvate/2-oxoglutarate dehydrogenase complex dihydrolipoamide dehydrogenase (E3) component